MKQDLTFLLGSAVLFMLLACFIQTKLLFSPDVGYLMYAAKKLMMGGKFGIDIFETNPPLIMYLYIPANLLEQYLFHDPMLALRFYILLLALLSSLSGIFLIRQIVTNNRFYLYNLYIILLSVFLLLPMYSFGQREHLFVILILPYLTYCMVYLHNGHSSFSYRFFIALIAGIGFAIKPFFYPTFFLIELYIIFKKKDFLKIFRIEPLTISIIAFIYLMSIYIWQPGFIHIILPLIFKYYFPFVKKSFIVMVSYHSVPFCIAVLVTYYFFLRKYDKYPDIGIVFWLSLVGTMITFFIPRQPWSYHLFPAMSFAYILLIHFFITIFSLEKAYLIAYLKQIILLAISLSIFFLVPLYNYYKTLFVTDVPNPFLKTLLLTQKSEKSVYCFSAFTFDCFPLVYITNSRYAESFSSFWWLGGIRAKEKAQNLNQVELDLLSRDKKFLIDKVADDLDTYKGHWVFVNLIYFQLTEGNGFNLIDYFLENKKFQSAFADYQYFARIGQFDVYERKF